MVLLNVLCLLASTRDLLSAIALDGPLSLFRLSLEILILISISIENVTPTCPSSEEPHLVEASDYYTGQ